VEGLARAEGRSLVPDLLRAVVPGPQAAFSNFQDIRRVVRAGRYKLVMRANMTTVVFDLEADPAGRTERELNDLPIAGRYLRILLGQYLGARNHGQWLRANQEESASSRPRTPRMDDTLRASSAPRLRELTERPTRVSIPSVDGRQTPHAEEEHAKVEPVRWGVS
jgi:hypothetical protein